MIKIYDRRGQYVRSDIRYVWEQSVSSSKYWPATKYLSDAFNAALIKGNTKENHPLTNWLLIQDEISFALSLVNLSTFGYVPSDDVCSRVCSVMTGALAGHLHAIRSLVTAGYDVQARALCRMISEHIDLMIVLSNNEQLCREYSKIESEKEANYFWHKYISKGKIRKEIRQILSQKSREAAAAYDEMLIFIVNEEEMMGMTIHPSYLSSAMVVGMGLSHGEGGIGMFGVVDVASIRTLKFLLFRLLELFIIGSEGIERTISRYSSKSDFVESQDLIERIVFCRNLLIYIAARHNEMPLGSQD